MRCFLAIELPPKVRDELARLQNRMSSVGRSVRWTRSKQIHLTMKFLGDVADGDLSALCDTARAVATRFEPMNLEVCGVGRFPPHGAPRIIWAGIADPPPAIFDCQQACEQAYAELGFAPENRPFRAHLTIGRVKDTRSSEDIQAVVQKQEQFSAGRFTATELVLFQSVLDPTGPTYTAIARAPFGSGSS